MSRSGRRPPGRAGPPSGEAWGIVGTLVAGCGFWGLVGYGVDRLLGTGVVFLPVGVIVGMGGALYLVIYRFGRHY
ncbi:AtpZ/AtpI family protein [Candidatus Protofrankia californiensis]|uniref:AtpZ/AtpI family protein n=1 Tax=Candidatus Protofrankia californiensis TaxID=1839754 RepID=UPI001040F566|nr:AtpZ/AtpI family protein [Candidatus Protofrankia californiensis]